MADKKNTEIQAYSLNIVRIKKDELLKALKKNREQHEGIFLEAQKLYRKETIRKLDQLLNEARNGQKIPSNISLSPPVNHNDDYDRVIKMLEMSVDNVFQLSQTEFTQYVQDDWDWSQSWANSNYNYISGAFYGTGSCAVSDSYTSSSYALTASWAPGTSAEYKKTATYVNKLQKYL